MKISLYSFSGAVVPLGRRLAAAVDQRQDHQAVEGARPGKLLRCVIDKLARLADCSLTHVAFLFDHVMTVEREPC